MESIGFPGRPYRVLVVPLAVLIPFGHFGSRRGQFGNFIIFIIVHSFCVFHYLLAVVMAISIPISLTDFRQTRTKFTVVFCILLVVLYTLKLYKFYKKYHLVCLLQEIKDVSQHCLKMKDMLVFLMITGLVLAVIVYEFRYLIEGLISNIKSGRRRPFSFTTNNRTVSKLGAPPKVTDMYPIKVPELSADDTCHRCIFKALHSTVPEHHSDLATSQLE